MTTQTVRLDRGRRPTPGRSLMIALLLAGVLGAIPVLVRAEAPTPKAPADSVSAPDTSAAPHRVLAYYFHTTKRCATCRKIEAFTTEAIRSGFPAEIKDGRLDFQVINVEDEGNEHFVEDYQLFTKSVVLVDQRSGKQVAWKVLPKIWELVNNKEKFFQYIQTETRGYLTGKSS